MHWLHLDTNIEQSKKNNKNKNKKQKASATKNSRRETAKSELIGKCVCVAFGLFMRTLGDFIVRL